MFETVGVLLMNLKVAKLKIRFRNDLNGSFNKTGVLAKSLLSF